MSTATARTAPASLTVDVEREFRATPERLYGLFTLPEKLSGWFGVPVKADPRVGGEITFDFGEEDKTRGVYKTLSPHDLVAFTWNSMGCGGETKGQRSGETLVTITLRPVGEGRTHLRLVHTGF